MPENKGYTKEIYDYLGTLDNNYHNDVSFDKFTESMKDKSYAKDIHDWIGGKDESFTKDVPFDSFYKSVNESEKKNSTPQGQGILKSGFGKSVSGGTKADFGSTTITEEQANNAESNVKRVKTKENPLALTDEELRKPKPIMDLSVGEKLKKEQEDNITSQDALNLHNTQLKDVLEHDENYFKNKNYKTDLSNNISEIISSDKNKGVYFDKKGAAIIDNVSKLVDGIAERAKKEQGVEISPLDKQKIILDAVASAKSKDVQLQAHQYADLKTAQKYGASISDFTDLTEKVADPTSKTGYKTIVVKEGIFSKMNKDYTNFSVQKNKELKTLYKKANTDVNAEIQPEIQQYKGEIEQQSNLLNNRIKEEFDAQVSQIGTEIQGKYQQLVSSGQMDAQTANAQSQAEYQKAQEDLQVGLQSKYKGDFDKLTSDVENKNKQFQLKYNKLYNQKTKSATEGANRELDLKLNELKSQYKVPYNILETYKKEYGVAYNKFTIDKNAKELASFRNLPTENKLAISFASGIGNLLSSTGGAMGWMGFENASLTLNKLAQQNAENAGVPAIQYNDLTFLSDPDWWIVNSVQSMPLMLATMPLSFGMGAAGGWMAKLAQAGTIDGEIAAALGEQTLTQEVASVAAGGFAGWASETMLEAGDSFSSAINEGKTKEEAAQIASATFKRDLATLPLSIAQMLPIFGKGFKFLETAGVETASNYLEEIAQGWAQTKSKAEQEGVDVSFGDYFFSSEAQQAGAAGAICGNLYTLAAFKKTDNKEKQLNSILNSITVGGASQARTQLEILKNNSVITNEEFVKANRLVGYTLKAIDKVSNININDDTKVALIGKFAEIEKFKELTTDNPQDLASQAAKEIIAEKEKEIKSILKGETPIYLVHPKGYEVPMVVTKDVALEIAKSNNASDFRIMVYNDDATQIQLDKINAKYDAQLQEISATPQEASASKEEPTAEQQLKDIQEGNTVTFTYNKESEVPDVFKNKISSKGEVNGKPYVKVTMAKSLADYHLQEQSLKEATKAEPIEPQKTDKDYQQAQEINTRISKEHPNASVLIQPKGEDLSLTAIYVGKNNRGKGIGSKVLESVKSEADKVGKKVVLDATNELDKETDIKRLGEFYEKNGFKKVGENKFEYEPKSQVEPITPKEGDIVELQPRVKGGMKPQAVFKDGKWQAKVGKEASEIGKAAQEEAQTAFESSNKPTLEPKNEVNGGVGGDVETKQQIENFGVNKADVEPVHNVISQVFDGLKKAGLTAAKTVGDWIGVGKGKKKEGALFQAEKLFTGEESLEVTERKNSTRLLDISSALTKWAKENSPLTVSLSKMYDTIKKATLKNATEADKARAEKIKRDFVRAIEQETNKELDVWYVESGGSYKSFYRDDIDIINKNIQAFAEQRYGRKLTQEEIDLYHMVSGWGSPQANPAFDSQVGLKILDRYMGGKGMKGEKILSGFTGNEGFVWEKILDKNGKPILDKNGKPRKRKTIAPSGKEVKYSVAYEAASVERLNDLIAYFDGDLKKAIEWTKTIHTWEEAKTVVGEENLSEHENFSKENGGFGMFALTGAKVGSYILNRLGEYSTSTKDMWYARTMARLTGEPLFVKKEKGVAEVLKAPWDSGSAKGVVWRKLADEAWRNVANKRGIEMSDVQERMWDFEKRLWEKFGATKDNAYASDGFFRQAKIFEPSLFESGLVNQETEPLFKTEEEGKVQAQYRIESGKNVVEAIENFNGSPRAVVALTHEIMHPTVVAIIDGAKEGNEVGAKHTKTIVDEFNKANPNSKVTVEQLIEGNDAFKDGTTSKQYRAVQEFIAKSWEKYHREGGKGFSEQFQKVLEQITKAFQSVYKSLSGKQLTPELRKMFDEILGKEAVEQSLKETPQEVPTEKSQVNGAKNLTNESSENPPIEPKNEVNGGEKQQTPEIIPEEVHTPIVSRLSKMGFAIKSLAGDSWHSAVELAKKGGAKFMSFGGYEKKGEKGTDLIESGGKRKQMTEDDKGNYLFFHYSKTKFNKLNPKKVGTHLATGRDERTATPVSSLYTRPDVGEANVPNDFGYVVRVPKDKVYDFNSDPLNLKKEAEARFKKENPNRAFDANNQLAEVAKLAAEKGFQVTVADWNIKGTKTLIAKTSESLPLENYNNIKLGTMNQIEFAKGMEDIKANAKRRDIKYNDVSVKYMTDANGNIFGFVKDGEITLNGDKKTANTPIHEAGHIWIGKVKEKNPELYKAGMDKVDGSKYLEDVKNEKLYQDEAAKLPEDMQEDYFKEEALAKAIGDNGEKFATDAKKSDFKTWVLSMWKAVAKEFGLHNMSPEDVSKLTLDEFSKKAAADILGGKGENAPENLKKLAEDNNLPSFRNVVNLVNKYVREVNLEEGKTITDAEVKQALKNKEEGVTREGWVNKTKESGRTVSYKENKIPVSPTYNEIVNENKHYYETLNIKENSNKAIEYLEDFGTDAKGLKDAYDDLMAAFAINPFTNPINGVAAEILSDKLYAQAVAENLDGNIDGYNEYVKLSNNLREASFKAATVAGQYTSALAILCRASNPEAFLMFVNGQINEIINNKNNVNKIKKIKTKTEEISDRINQAKKESINEIVNSKSIPSKSGISTSISKIRERGLKRQQESLVKLSKIGHLGSNGLSNESIEAVGDLILSQIELGIYNIANIAQKIIVLTNGKVKAEHIKEVLTKYKTNYEGEDVYLKDAIEKISAAEKLAKEKALLGKGEIEKFSEKRVSEDVRKIKTLNDLLKANLEAGSTIEAMASEMVETFSMSQKEADIIANKYYNGYKKLLEEKIDKILKKELGIKTIAYFEKLDNSTETKSYEKTFGGKIVNQILAGGLDSQMLSQAFSLKYGLPILTPAISDHIKLLASRAKAATTPTSLLFANKNLLSYIHSIVPSDFMSVLNSAYYISMLSGVSTAVVNTVGNLHELINLRTENAIVSIIEASKGEKDNLVSGKNSINKIQYIIKNFQEAMISALDIMQHGGGESKYFNISQKDLKQTDAEELKLKRGWVKDLTFKNLLSTLGKTWYTVPVVVVRNLDALDIAFGKLNYNIIAVRETRKELAKTGLKGKELEAATFQKVYGTKEIIQKAIEDAIVEANNIGANQSERKKLVKRIAYDLIQKSLSEQVQSIANETSREYTFKGKSRGFTGALAKKIPQTAIITPFVQTAMKVVESGMNYIPVYGGMRYAGLSITDIARNVSESVDTWYTSKGIERTKREGDFRNRQLAQVILSHTLLLTLYALSKIKWHDDDKNEDVPFVDISGGYLGVPMTKRAEAEKVMPQYMIRIGNFTVNYTLNPALAMVCLPLSIEMDRRRAHQDERTVTGDVLSYAGALPIFLLEQTPLQSVNDFAKSLRNIADKTSGLDNYEELGKLLEKAVLSVPSTLLEPNLYKQSENFHNPTKYNANTVVEVAWKCFNMEKIGGLDYKYDHWGREVELYPNETKFPIHFWLQQAGDDAVDNWALKNNLTLPILNPKTLVLDMTTMSSSTKKSFDEKQKNLAEYYDIIESENQNYKKENQIDVSVFTPNFKVLTYKEWHDMDKSTRFSVYNIIKDNLTKLQESHPSFITKPFSEMNKIEAQIIVDNLFKVEKINYIKEKFPIK